jgi:hypothetical protein
MLIIGLILVIMIEYVMYYLCELCFDARKLLILIVVFFFCWELIESFN